NLLPRVSETFSHQYFSRAFIPEITFHHSHAESPPARPGGIVKIAAGLCAAVTSQLEWVADFRQELVNL
ncbi:MAG TPA: hypothetical protein VFV08_02630, partial [Puia sp.]|nr:hypothetical protein [Puia sp.]